jgi:hypothetical protein
MLDRLAGELLENGNKRDHLSGHTIGSYLRRSTSSSLGLRPKANQ